MFGMKPSKFVLKSEMGVDTFFHWLKNSGAVILWQDGQVAQPQQVATEQPDSNR